ncbi:flagellar hook-length control protein FliK [Xanthobacter wiegelii]|uniref:flagellar hook-length control protein FliK n=1 Tax=Xanthobacter wiegelii TaxID=3119913 RepID=UPI00372829C6
MRTADIAQAAVARPPDLAGRAALPDGQPFDDLLSGMGEAPAAPVPETVAEVPPADASPCPPPASLDRLLARCARSDPEREAIETPHAPRRAPGLLRPEAEPVDTADAAPAPLPDAPAPDTPDRPQPPPLLALLSAPLAGPRDVSAEVAPQPRASPPPVPLAVPAVPAETAAEAPAPMRVAVLRQETHFAPVRPFTPEPPPALAEAAREAPAAPAVEAQPPSREGRIPIRPLPLGAAADDGAPNDQPEPRRADARQSPGTARAAAAPAVLDDRPPAPVRPAEATPALPFASLAQIGRAIAAEVAQMDTAPAAAGTGAPLASEDAPVPTGPVRVLDIALSPDSLGRVVVHMRLTPHGLTVRLKADDPATAALLAGDRAHLSALLGSAGLPDVDLEVGGAGLPVIDAPLRAPAAMEGPPPQDTADHPDGGSRGGADPGRQGRGGRNDRTYPDDDAAPSFADEPRFGAG